MFCIAILKIAIKLKMKILNAIQFLNQISAETVIESRGDEMLLVCNNI